MFINQQKKTKTMRQIKLILGSLAMSAAIFTGCSKEQTEVTPQSASASSSANSKMETSPLQWQSAYAFISMATYSGNFYGKQINWKAEQTGKVDLLAGSPYAGLQLERGMYKDNAFRVRINSREVRETMNMRGTYNVNGESMPVVVSFKGTMELQARQGEMNVTGEKTPAFIDVKKINQLILEADPLKLERDRDQVVMISENINPQLYRNIMKTLEGTLAINY
jgi:hypothetical protein